MADERVAPQAVPLPPALCCGARGGGKRSCRWRDRWGRTALCVGRGHRARPFMAGLANRHRAGSGWPGIHVFSSFPCSKVIPDARMTDDRLWVSSAKAGTHAAWVNAIAG